MPERIRELISPGVAKISTAALIWGSMGVLIRFVPASPVVIVFWRGAFAALILLLVIVGGGRGNDLLVRKRRIGLPITGVLLLVSMVFFTRAVQLTTVANAILVVYTAPVLIALLAPLVLGEALRRRTLAALPLAVVGIGLIVAPQGLSFGGRHLTGIGLAGVTAVAYALLVLVGKRVVADLSARVVAFYQSAIAVLVLLPFIIGQPLPPSAASWVMLATLGIVHTALAGMLYLAGLRDVSAQEAGMLAYLEPLSGATFGMVFLGEPLTLWLVAGGVLIVVAGWMVVAVRPPESTGLPK